MDRLIKIKEGEAIPAGFRFIKKLIIEVHRRENEGLHKLLVDGTKFESIATNLNSHEELVLYIQELVQKQHPECKKMYVLEVT